MSSYYGYMVNCDCSYCEQERKREEADKVASEKAAEAAKAAHPVPTERLLTLQMVLKGSPCYEYRSKFEERYGENGVVVTVAKALSESGDWEWEWAGTVLLSRKAKAEFSKRSREAEKAYDTAMQPYWDLVNAAFNKYYEARDVAWTAASNQYLSYTEKVDAANKASQGIMTIPQAASRAADEIATKVRSDARIIAFAELFITDAEAYELEHKDDEPFQEYDENYDDYEENYDNY
jgi:hypothetical protein